MPFCGYCGTEVAPGQKFCGECGAPLPAQPAPQQASPPPPPPPLTAVFGTPPHPAQPEPPSPPFPGDVAATAAMHGAPPHPAQEEPPVPPFPGDVAATIAMHSTPAAPSPALPPPPAPEKNLPGRSALIAGAVIVLLLLAAALWFSGILSPGLAGKSPQPTPKVTPPATARSPAAPTTARTTALPTPSPSPTGVLHAEDRYEETYEVVYSKSGAFNYGDKIRFPYSLTNPPLYVKFTVTPPMVNRTKIINIGTSTEQTVYTTYEDPAAWFEVKILSSDGNAEIASEGFGVSKGHNVVTSQEFMVRTGGDYIIEISGNRVTADIRILIGTS